MRRVRDAGTARHDGTRMKRGWSDSVQSTLGRCATGRKLKGASCVVATRARTFEREAKSKGQAARVIVQDDGRARSKVDGHGEHKDESSRNARCSSPTRAPPWMQFE